MNNVMHDGTPVFVVWNNTTNSAVGPLVYIIREPAQTLADTLNAEFPAVTYSVENRFLATR
jgi:hypothetical protein